MSKKQVNEKTAASKFVDSFFKGLSKNAAKRMIDQAKKSNMEPEIIQKMEKLEKEREELDAIINKYSK